MSVRQAMREFRRMHTENQSRVRRPVGNAINLGEYWLWGGVEVQKSKNTEIHDLGNGTEMDLKSGEVFSVDISR